MNEDVKRRFQIDLAGGHVRRISWLKEMTEAVSWTQVIRDAMRVYAFMVECVLRGDNLIVEDQNGNRTECKFLNVERDA